MAAESKTTSVSHPRPLSPHLQVYRPQMTSILSITHRATGVALSVGTLLLVWWLVAAATGESAYAQASAFMGSWLGKLLLLGWTASLFYHLGNGIRHLFWDAGYGFEIGTAEKSGWFVLAFTVAATILSWALGMAVLGGR